jgi:hypothetical protein
MVTEAKTRTGVESTNRDPVELSDSLVLKVEGIEFLYALTERCAQLLGVDRRESRARRLWPRNLLTPFVADMALTPGRPGLLAVPTPTPNATNPPSICTPPSTTKQIRH